MVALKVPPVPLLLLQLTDPVGALAVPALVSVMVAVQVVAGLLTKREVGEQLTDVLVARRVTVKLTMPLLAA